MNGAKTLSDVQEEQMQLKNDIDNLLDQNKTKKKTNENDLTLTNVNELLKGNRCFLMLFEAKYLL